MSATGSIFRVGQRRKYPLHDHFEQHSKPFWSLGRIPATPISVGLFVLLLRAFTYAPAPLVLQGYRCALRVELDSQSDIKSMDHASDYPVDCSYVIATVSFALVQQADHAVVNKDTSDIFFETDRRLTCLLYTSPSPRD